jgi:hypothetical protein
VGLALLMGLAACGRQPSSRDFDPHRARWEFVAVNGHREGLILQLPEGFRGFPEKALPQGFLKGYRPREGYRPQDEGAGTVSRGIDLDVLPLPPRAAQLTPEAMVAMFAMAYREKECRAGFAVRPLGPLTEPARPGFAALLSCGRAPQGVSDTTLVVAMKGQTDLFILNWFERGSAQDAPLPVDLRRWTQRLRELGPRLCPAESVGGSPRPSPSCVVALLPGTGRT